MDTHQQCLHPPAAPEGPLSARADRGGAIICPHCGPIIITPADHELRCGVGRCPRCDQYFTVSRAPARKANRLLASADVSVIKRVWRTAISAGPLRRPASGDLAQ